MISKLYDGEWDYFLIGIGGWDLQGCELWVDIEQLYSVYEWGLCWEVVVLDWCCYDWVSVVFGWCYGWIVVC